MIKAVKTNIKPRRQIPAKWQTEEEKYWEARANARAMAQQESSFKLAAE